jgi:hypothetical protein
MVRALAPTGQAPNGTMVVSAKMTLQIKKRTLQPFRRENEFGDDARYRIFPSFNPARAESLKNVFALAWIIVGYYALRIRTG